MSKSPEANKPSQATDSSAEQAQLSKTKLKASADALQALGVKMIDLPDSKLQQLQLPEDLLAAIKQAQKIRANGALRRQRQYIGSLMRDIDAQPIIEQFEKWEGKNQAENAFFHLLERRRDQLIFGHPIHAQPAEATAIDQAQADQALAQFIAQFPSVDTQQLRTLIRNARKEAQQNKSPKSSRLLFKLLREVCSEAQSDE